MRKMIATVACAVFIIAVAACGGSDVSREEFDSQNSQLEDLQENRSEQESAGDDSQTNDSDLDVTNDEDAAQPGGDEESLQNRLIGVWAEVDDGGFIGDAYEFVYIEFHRDGTGLFSEFSYEEQFSWSLDDNLLTLSYDEYGVYESEIYFSQRNGIELMLTATYSTPEVTAGSAMTEDIIFVIDYIKIDSNTTLYPVALADETANNHLIGTWVNFNQGRVADDAILFPYTTLEQDGTGVASATDGNTLMFTWSFEGNQLTFENEYRSYVSDVELYSGIGGLDAIFINGSGPFIGNGPFIKIDFEPIFPAPITTQN